MAKHRKTRKGWGFGAVDFKDPKIIAGSLAVVGGLAALVFGKKASASETSPDNGFSPSPDNSGAGQDSSAAGQPPASPPGTPAAAAASQNRHPSNLAEPLRKAVNATLATAKQNGYPPAPTTISQADLSKITVTQIGTTPPFYIVKGLPPLDFTTALLYAHTSAKVAELNAQTPLDKNYATEAARNANLTKGAIVQYNNATTDEERASWMRQAIQYAATTNLDRIMASQSVANHYSVNAATGASQQAAVGPRPDSSRS